MTIAELIAGLSIELVRGSGSTDVREIVEDSRRATVGCLFAARMGTEMDGRSFIADAVAAGAVAVLCRDARAIPAGVISLVAEDVALAAAQLAERFHGHPSEALRLVGITGTNGKTTTAHLIHHMLNHGGIRCGLVGTVQIDDGAALGPAALTTPSAIDLSGLLRTMVDHGCTRGVIEVSSHALHQGRTAALHFEAAVFTNLSGDHLDYHGTMDAYARAKASLFRSLPSGGWAIVNRDDPVAEDMVDGCEARVLTCSLADRKADCFAEVRRQAIEGVEAIFHGPWGSFQVCLPLVGRHNIANALEAAAAGFVLGLDGSVLSSGLNCCSAPPGRLEPVPCPDREFSVLVDYAHTDDALANVLRSLRPLVGDKGKLRVVFGCGGDRDRTKRPRMAQVAAEYADEVIITSDNPRSEDPQAIIEDILRGLAPDRRADTSTIVDRRCAIELAISRARRGDVVLIAGKGHEPYQIIGSQRRPFDDRLVAAEVLQRMHAEAVP